MIKTPAHFPSSENDFWEVMGIISDGRHVIVKHDIHTYEYKMSDRDNYVERKIINSLSNIMSVGGLPVIAHYSGDNNYHLLDIGAFSRSDKSWKNYQIIK